MYPEAEGWRSRASCLGMDQAVFFPSKGLGARRARLVCGGCPVAAECLDHALSVEEPSYRYGIWGGLTGPERGALGRQARAS